MRSLAWLLLATLLANLVPTTLAQNQGPVAKCARECTPADVNGGTVKTGDEPVSVILYGHFEDLLQMAPLNTQPPDPDQERDLNGGFLMPVIETNTPACVSGTCPANFAFVHNVFTLYSTPGFVEYLSDGSWRTHQEPGLAADVNIAAPEFNLYWYLSSHALPGQKSTDGTGQAARVGVMPQVAIYARMETGRHRWHGTPLAESDDYDATPPADPDRVNLITHPGEPNDVWEFQVKMKVKTATVPSSETAAGFVVSVIPYQVRDGKNKGTQFAQEEWRLRTGPNWLPRLVIPVERTMENRAAGLSIFEDRMFVRWSFLSAWGSYDMRDASLDLKVTGPNKVDAKAIELVILKRGIDHDSHFKPVNATWAVDYVNYPLPDGAYELTASILNLQGTYRLEQKFAFEVVGGVPDVPVIGQARQRPSDLGAAAGQSGGGDSPGLGALGALIAAVAGVVLARRRSM